MIYVPIECIVSDPELRALKGNTALALLDGVPQLGLRQIIRFTIYPRLAVRLLAPAGILIRSLTVEGAEPTVPAVRNTDRVSRSLLYDWTPEVPSHTGS